MTHTVASVLERLIDVLDRDFVRRHPTEMLPHDPRIASWDEICEGNPRS